MYVAHITPSTKTAKVFQLSENFHFDKIKQKIIVIDKAGRFEIMYKNIISVTNTRPRIRPLKKKRGLNLSCPSHLVHLLPATA